MNNGNGITWEFEDARMLTEDERRRLAQFLYLALCDLRILGREGRSAQAKDLAEAIHNVPLLMYSDDFSFRIFRERLERYQKKHEGNLLIDYLQEWEKLCSENNVS